MDEGRGDVNNTPTRSTGLERSNGSQDTYFVLQHSPRGPVFQRERTGRDVSLLAQLTARLAWSSTPLVGPDGASAPAQEPAREEGTASSTSRTLGSIFASWIRRQADQIQVEPAADSSALTETVTSTADQDGSSPAVAVDRIPSRRSQGGTLVGAFPQALRPILLRPQQSQPTTTTPWDTAAASIVPSAAVSGPLARLPSISTASDTGTETPTAWQADAAAQSGELTRRVRQPAPAALPQTPPSQRGSVQQEPATPNAEDPQADTTATMYTPRTPVVQRREQPDTPSSRFNRTRPANAQHTAAQPQEGHDTHTGMLQRTWSEDSLRQSDMTYSFQLDSHGSDWQAGAEPRSPTEQSSSTALTVSTASDYMHPRHQHPSELNLVHLNLLVDNPETSTASRRSTMQSGHAGPETPSSSTLSSNPLWVVDQAVQTMHRLASTSYAPVGSGEDSDASATSAFTLPSSHGSADVTLTAAGATVTVSQCTEEEVAVLRARARGTAREVRTASGQADLPRGAAAPPPPLQLSDASFDVASIPAAITPAPATDFLPSRMAEAVPGRSISAPGNYAPQGTVVQYSHVSTSTEPPRPPALYTMLRASSDGSTADDEAPAGDGEMQGGSVNGVAGEPRTAHWGYGMLLRGERRRAWEEPTSGAPASRASADGARPAPPQRRLRDVRSPAAPGLPIPHLVEPPPRSRLTLSMRSSSASGMRFEPSTRLRLRSQSMSGVAVTFDDSLRDAPARVAHPTTPARDPAAAPSAVRVRSVGVSAGGHGGVEVVTEEEPRPAPRRSGTSRFSGTGNAMANQQSQQARIRTLLTTRHWTAIDPPNGNPLHGMEIPAWALRFGPSQTVPGPAQTDTAPNEHTPKRQDSGSTHELTPALSFANGACSSSLHMPAADAGTSGMVRPGPSGSTNVVCSVHLVPPTPDVSASCSAAHSVCATPAGGRAAPALTSSTFASTPSSRHESHPSTPTPVLATSPVVVHGQLQSEATLMLLDVPGQPATRAQSGGLPTPDAWDPNRLLPLPPMGQGDLDSTAGLSALQQVAMHEAAAFHMVHGADHADVVSPTMHHPNPFAAAGLAAQQAMWSELSGPHDVEHTHPMHGASTMPLAIGEPHGRGPVHGVVPMHGSLPCSFTHEMRRTYLELGRRGSQRGGTDNGVALSRGSLDLDITAPRRATADDATPRASRLRVCAPLTPPARRATEAPSMPTMEQLPLPHLQTDHEDTRLLSPRRTLPYEPAETIEEHDLLSMTPPPLPITDLPAPALETPPHVMERRNAVYYADGLPPAMASELGLTGGTTYGAHSDCAVERDQGVGSSTQAGLSASQGLYSEPFEPGAVFACGTRGTEGGSVSESGSGVAMCSAATTECMTDLKAWLQARGVDMGSECVAEMLIWLQAQPATQQ